METAGAATYRADYHRASNSTDWIMRIIHTNHVPGRTRRRQFAYYSLLASRFTSSRALGHSVLLTQTIDSEMPCEHLLALEPNLSVSHLS